MRKNRHEIVYRTFPHANSLRAQAARFPDDLKEVLEYTSVPITLRNGKRQIPSVYDDVIACEHGKWKSKPRKNNISRRTIRKEKTVFLRLDFTDGSFPYVFFGTCAQIAEELARLQKYYRIDDLKKLTDGSILGTATDKHPD